MSGPGGAPRLLVYHNVAATHGALLGRPVSTSGVRVMLIIIIIMMIIITIIIITLIIIC